MEDPENSTLKEGLDFVIGARYRGRKSELKVHFLDEGGYEDVEKARANPPEGMSAENWSKAINYYTSEKHIRRSNQNKINKAKQVVTNRGGTSSLSSACHKHVSYGKNCIYRCKYFLSVI